MAFVGLLAPERFSQFYCHPFYVKTRPHESPGSPEGGGGGLDPTLAAPSLSKTVDEGTRACRAEGVAFKCLGCT